MRKSKLRYYIHTFGCQMNENDSEHLAGLLNSSGLEPALSPEESELIIVNTCAVREKSEQKLYSLLGRLESIKKKNKALIGVVGCVAQLYRSKLWDKKPSIDFVIGPDNYWQIPHLLPPSPREKVISTQWSTEWHEIPFQQVRRESLVSAYITIMEGCNNFCAYCVVPFTRGREKSRPMSHILAEAEDLAFKRYKEIQLLGQNVNSYEDPDTGHQFPVLLEEIDHIEGIEWIRFITSHPKNFTKNIALAMKEASKVCHQLHLPIQSGSTSVLQRMNRDYTREEYLEKIAVLRDLMPDISLSSDIIVGFPGETQEEFDETLSLIETVRFTNIFSFRYSPRPFTSASKEKDNVTFEEKKKRLIQVQALQKKIQLEVNRSFLGQTQKVLCTGRSKKDPHVYSGRNQGYQVVNFNSNKEVIHQFLQVRITSCGPYSLFGQAV
ncbi:MAG: tRNA (N6-isopentenyl adenosine(37)-C2)-methylthiotransferase MiaB [Candidatus Aminicenantes bacterium]|nr:tRNA (N6-isopentenyl adenosine(37)-C2)-methylthiotransferase MiaB [Candidatus Aminicenantes bacterium]MDH5383595.1 tRNA (N6-isopentenyl adenosine(37)-C2)-methylthiotransferase MiaB [Candidatus Aminicenantes bacterium]MDH5742990.1 tRNA (N6-isopentenyl adenosine(37)-C2)-methylthiotransferase MiaB [Candidatus Aminicenantes bacterium]